MNQNLLKRRREAGFTLVETLISFAVLTVVISVALSYVNRLQKVYVAETTKVDATTSARTLLDDMQRELHQSGFPAARLYAPTILISPAINDSRVAAGLVRVSSSDLGFEGDIDGDGQVESVRYTLMNSAGAPASGGGNCPCTLQRSQMAKPSGSPMAVAPLYSDALTNVINSGGAAGGGAGLALTGSSGGVANDTLFAAYKDAPLFSAFDKNGGTIPLPIDISSNPKGLAKIKSIVINVNTLTSRADLQTKNPIPLSVKLAAAVNSY